MFTYANAHKKSPLEIHFIYLGNKEIYCIFKTSCIICILFSMKCCLYHNFTFFCSNNTFFIHHALKSQYQPGFFKVKNKKINGNSHDQ